MNEKIIETGKGLKDGQQFCPNCGATNIRFNKKYGKLYCESCETIFEGKIIENLEKDLSNLDGTVIGSGSKKINKDFKDIITLKCNGCGAEIMIDTKEKTYKRCHWCRGLLSINTRIENGTVPDAILPFKITKEKAVKTINKYVKKRKLFASKEFKNDFSQENIVGVYLPYMIIDAKTYCNFEGVGEHSMRIYHWEDTIAYEAKRYKVKREFEIQIDDLTTEAIEQYIDTSDDSRTNNIINSLMPFDTENSVKFSSNYLYGFNSENRNINIDDVKYETGIKIKDIARKAINKDLNFYDRGVRWEKENAYALGTQWITCYLPIWLYTYKDKNKDETHFVAANGRTGEVSGSIPINMKKLWMAAIIVQLISILLIPKTAEMLGILEDIAYNFIDLIYIILAHMLPGPVFFKLMKKLYRRKDLRYKYEKETKYKVTILSKEDKYIDTIGNLKTKKIQGANNDMIYGYTTEKPKKITDKIADWIYKNK